MVVNGIFTAILRIFASFKAQNRKELRSRPVFVIVVLHLDTAEWGTIRVKKHYHKKEFDHRQWKAVSPVA